MVFKKGNEIGKATRFEPGKSGNPAGLPKGYKSFKRLIAEAVAKPVVYKDLKNKKKPMKAREAIINAIVAKAIFKQDVQAAKTIIDAMEEFDLIALMEEQYVEAECKVIDQEPTDLSGLTDEELNALEIVANIYQKGDSESEPD